MNYRIIPKTGDKISILGYGCMRLPVKHGKIDEKRASAQIYRAIDLGVNYFDTAMPYHLGESEPFLGKILSGEKRDKIKIATKLPPWSIKKKDDMNIIIDTQLRRLKTDRIDYYLLHALQRENWKRLNSLDVLNFLEKQKEAGKIIYKGFSFHGDRETFREIIDAYDWDFCQIQFNYLDVNRQAGLEGLKYAASKGIGIVIMEPLRGGALAKTPPKAIKHIWDEAETKRTPAEWSLRWIWNHPEVTCILSGMNEEKHIEENLRIASDALPYLMTDKELNIVERVAGKYHELMKIGCTGCGYCLPCPAGVNIPACFELFNRKNMFGDSWQSKVFYMGWVAGFSGGKPAYASLCKNCGKCVKKCPQNLPIPEYLKQVAKEFDGLEMKFMIKLAGSMNFLFNWWETRNR